MAVLTSTDAVLRTATVVERRLVADGVVALSLSPVDGNGLPTWAPGAHIDLVLPSGLVRQYSLCGEVDDQCYTIAVLREANGRGGSAEVHDRVEVGTEITIRGPRNHFPLEAAAGYLFIGGGIGITPMLPMIRAAVAAGVDWRLIYGGRTISSMAFVEEAVALDPARVTILPEDTEGRPDLDRLLDTLPEGWLVYACGPGGLLDVLSAKCAQRDLAGRLHLERFGAPIDAIIAPLDGDQPFELVLARSGVTVQVAADQSIFDAVQEVAPDLLFSCSEGYCGTCQVQVLEGVPDHRDTVCSASEHEEEGSMIICVGRSRTPRLVIDA